MNAESRVFPGQHQTHVFVPTSGIGEYVHLYGITNEFSGTRERAADVMTFSVFGSILPVDEHALINSDTAVYYTRTAIWVPECVLPGDTIMCSTPRSNPRSNIFNWRIETSRHKWPLFA